MAVENEVVEPTPPGVVIAVGLGALVVIVLAVLAMRRLTTTEERNDGSAEG